jgi:hypothetical protein
VTEGGDERITLHRPPHLFAHAASPLPWRRMYATAIARADQRSTVYWREGWIDGVWRPAIAGLANRP